MILLLCGMLWTRTAFTDEYTVIIARQPTAVNSFLRNRSPPAPQRRAYGFSKIQIYDKSEPFTDQRKVRICTLWKRAIILIQFRKSGRGVKKVVVTPKKWSWQSKSGQTAEKAVTAFKKQSRLCKSVKKEPITGTFIPAMGRFLRKMHGIFVFTYIGIICFFALRAFREGVINFLLFTDLRGNPATLTRRRC